jgi:hypothetical protein
MLWVTPEERRPQSGRKGGRRETDLRGGRPFIECVQRRDSRCTMVLTAWGSGPKKSGYEPAKMEPTSPVHNPHPGFRNYRSRRQLVAFQKRFRLGLPLPEIRPEFDRNTSNAGMLQSEMRYLTRSQEFHRLSTRRHRVLSRQSGGLRRKNPGPSRASLLRLIFSPVAFVFSS